TNSLVLHSTIYCVSFLLFYHIPRLSKFTLFPYTTLFRSGEILDLERRLHRIRDHDALQVERQRGDGELDILQLLAGVGKLALPRSEEHTSELQSRFELVCRLQLEKKKCKITITISKWKRQ